MKLRCAAFIVLAAVSCAVHGQWDRAKIESFAAEYRRHADSMTPDRSGQMLGALAELGMDVERHAFAKVQAWTDEQLASPKSFNEAVRADQEIARLAVFSFNALATEGDFARATALLQALDEDLPMPAADETFVDAPFFSRCVLVRRLVGSTRSLPLLAAMLDTPTLQNDPWGRGGLADMIADTIPLNKDIPHASVVPQLMKHGHFKQAVAVIDACPQLPGAERHLKTIGVHAHRKGNVDTLEALRKAFSKVAMQSKQNPAPALAWLNALSERPVREIVADIEKRVRASESSFAWHLEELAEGLLVAGNAAEIDWLKTEFPQHRSFILRGVFRGNMRLGDESLARLTLEAMPIDFERVFLAIEEGALDLAIVQFDAQQASLEGWPRYHLTRTLARSLLDAGRPKEALRFLNAARDQLLLPDPGFPAYDVHIAGVACDYGRLGELKTMKTTMDSMRDKTTMPLPTVLVESFMAAFRAGLIRK